MGYDCSHQLCHSCFTKERFCFSCLAKSVEVEAAPSKSAKRSEADPSTQSQVTRRRQEAERKAAEIENELNSDEEEVDEDYEEEVQKVPSRSRRKLNIIAAWKDRDDKWCYRAREIGSELTAFVHSDRIPKSIPPLVVGQFIFGRLKKSKSSDTSPSKDPFVIESLSLPSGFQEGEVNGTVLAQIKTGADLCNILLHQPPEALEGAVDPATLRSRFRILELIQDTLCDNPQFQDWGATMACIEALWILKQQEEWKWSTMATAMGHLGSVLRRLDMYSKGIQPHRLGDHSSWQEFSRKIRKNMHLEEVKQAKPCTKEVVVQLINKFREEGQEGAAVLLLLAWSHAARVGNVMTLKFSNFHNQNLSIRWTLAKTTAARGPYTTDSQYGPFHDFLMSYLEKHKSSPLFTTADEKLLRTSLKEVDSLHDLRSLRRGALQSLATTGTNVPTLLRFSGHTSEKSLMRYLGWGSKFHKGFQDATSAAQESLWQAPLTPTHSSAIAI